MPGPTHGTVKPGKRPHGVRACYQLIFFDPDRVPTVALQVGLDLI